MVELLSSGAGGAAAAVMNTVGRLYSAPATELDKIIYWVFILVLAIVLIIGLVIELRQKSNRRDKDAL